jgi:hypothetical protein
VLNAYYGVEEYNLALLKLVPIFEGLYIDLRSAIGTFVQNRSKALYQENSVEYDQY